MLQKSVSSARTTEQMLKTQRPWHARKGGRDRRKYYMNSSSGLPCQLTPSSRPRSLSLRPFKQSIRPLRAGDSTNASPHSHGGEPAEQTHAMTEMNGMLCSVLRGPCILEQINTCVHPPNRARPARSPPISATRPHPALFSGVCVIPGDPQQRRRPWGSVAIPFNGQTWLLHKWYQYPIKMIF